MNMPAWEEISGLVMGAAPAVVKAILRIALIVVAGAIGTRVLRTVLRRLEGLLVRAGEATELVPGSTRKRVATLTGLLRTIGRVVIWTVVLLVCLDQIGMDVRPVLAGAGIVGLAVGFGAQSLVKDLIAGFFLVLENHVRVGDVAVVNGTGGLVEAVTFRTIVLRDLAGVVHVFPNGSIETLANMTKGWSAYLMDIGVAYKEDTDRVIAVMREVAEGLRRDPTLGSDVLEPIEVFGVDEFADSQVTIKARIKTLPIRQWAVGREYRRRLKKAFDAAGIEIPFPHRTLHMGEVSKPFDVLLRGGGDRGESVSAGPATPAAGRPAP